MSGLVLAGCSGSPGGTPPSSPADSPTAPRTSDTSVATGVGSDPTQAAPVAFGTEIASPDSGADYTGAFPAGVHGTSTILTYVVSGDSPGVVLQPVDAAGKAGSPTELVGRQDHAACGLAATTLHGAAAVSTLYFVERAAQGVVPAEYDAYLYTWDGTDPIARTLIAGHVQGVPSCAASAATGVESSTSFGGTYENQWVIDGATDSRNVVAVSYQPSHESKDPDTRNVLVAIDADTATPITMKEQQSLYYVAGNGVIGACGADSMSAEPCAASADGKTSHPSIACGAADANCTYSNLPGSDGLAVEAQRTGGVQSTDSVGRVLDPLTGAVRFTTGDVPYPDAAVYDKASGTIIVLGDHSNATGDNEVSAFNATSGAELWTVPASKLCGSNAGGVLVAANGQLALLSAHNGKQIASTDAVHDCTAGPGAGIGIADGGRLISLLTD